MTNTSHTPGPWSSEGNGVHHGYKCVALTYADDQPQRIADARLIAKAPELFKIVQRLVEMKQGVDKCYGQYDHYILKLGAEVMGEMSRLVAEIEGEQQ